MNKLQRYMQKPDFKKTVLIGKMFDEYIKKDLDIFCFIEYKTKDNKERCLSISGVIEPKANGDADSCGQIKDTIKENKGSVELALDWDIIQFETFLDIWDKYHLNDLKAGTPKQEKAIKEWKRKGNKYDYTKACEYLESIDILEDNSIKYGHKWNFEEVPQKAIDFLYNLKHIDAPGNWRQK